MAPPSKRLLQQRKAWAARAQQKTGAPAEGTDETESLKELLHNVQCLLDDGVAEAKGRVAAELHASCADIDEMFDNLPMSTQ